MASLDVIFLILSHIRYSCTFTIPVLPTVQLPTTTSLAATSKNANQREDGVVLVIGGTSGIGQLTTQKLVAAGKTVRITTRSPETAQEIFTPGNTGGEGDGAVQIVPLDLLSFTDAEFQKLLEGVSDVIISVGTTAFPTTKWKGGNTPKAIDNQAVSKIAYSLSRAAFVQKVVLVTSIGVERRDEMPFRILNLFGVLDAKRVGETAIQQCGRDFVIVRPGRLVGAPFTNLDVANLLQVQGGDEDTGVDIAAGDTLLGDCKREACADCIVQALESDAAKNVIFSIVSVDGPAKTSETWESAFAALG